MYILIYLNVQGILNRKNSSFDNCVFQNFLNTKPGHTKQNSRVFSMLTFYVYTKTKNPKHTSNRMKWRFNIFLVDFHITFANQQELTKLVAYGKVKLWDSDFLGAEVISLNWCQSSSILSLLKIMEDIFPSADLIVFN